MPQRNIKFIQVELFRVEFAADPLDHFFVLFMAGIADRRQKIFVSARAAAVLGRAGAGAADTARIPNAGLGRQNFLQQYLMLPAIAEVYSLVILRCRFESNRPSPFFLSSLA